MKRFLTLLLLALATTSARAQIQIGSAEIPTMMGGGAFNGAALELLKKKTTVFFIQESDVARKADFEKALKGVWTITPFIVAGPDEMDAYADGRKYSQAGFGGYIIQKQGRSGVMNTSTHLTYDFFVADYNNSGKQAGRTLLARFLVSPDAQTLRQSASGVGMFGQRRDQKERTMMSALYTTAKFANWGPGYLRGYAKTINDLLLSKTRRNFNTGTKDGDALAVLKRDTLFLPRSLQNRYSGLTGQERMAGDDDDDDKDEGDDMRSAYEFKSAWIDDAELQQRILSATKPIYYLLYIRSSSEKHVSVFNGQTGQMLYTDYSMLSYNFKGKDLKKLAKAVD